MNVKCVNLVYILLILLIFRDIFHSPKKVTSNQLMIIVFKAGTNDVRHKFATLFKIIRK